MLTYDHRLPWITNSIRKLINKIIKCTKKRKENPKKFQQLKQSVQKELRKAYWDYIEQIIYDLPINEADQHTKQESSQQEIIFFYEKHQR